MKDLPLGALRAIAAVHAEGGVRAAAKKLGIAHSSVSRHLNELQKFMKVALLERNARPRAFALTPQGIALGQAALGAMQSLERAVHTSREDSAHSALIVSTTPSIAARWLLPRLADFESRHRDVQVSLSVEQKVENLGTSDIDVAIRMGKGPWPDFDCEPLMDDALYPVMSPAFFARSKRPSLPRHLKTLKLLHDRDPSASWNAWRDAYGPEDLDVRSGPRLTSSDLVIRAAVLSQGVALARERLLGTDIETGTLIRPFGDRSVAIKDAYWIVKPLRSRHKPNVGKCVAWLKEQAAKH